ncbi:MAG TPA: tripartite tricarboxylate transporter substrate binding protein, partial [Burkholderiales bacterium]|nr:tripartite tricarboxylate transporter substrate binding protein [Burkholderiales bacterium]
PYARLALAQDFPSRTIRFVVPFPPGGGTDILARTLSPPLNRAFGQSVVVDNRAGGNTVIGTEVVARAPADGHTLLVIAPSFSINPFVRSKLPYDTVKDFSAVARVINTPLAISVHPSLPAKDIKGLIALARAKPGELSFATSSIVGGQRIAAELFFRERAKVDIISVPYNGGAPAATAVMGGHSTILVSNLSEASQQITAGRLRGIAVMSLARTAQLPTLPTLAESGYPGFDAANWYGVMIRSATPRAVIERLGSEIGKALHTTEVRDNLARVGLDIAYLGPTDFDAYIRAEMTRNESILKKLKLKVD